MSLFLTLALALVRLGLEDAVRLQIDNGCCYTLS